MNIEIVDIQQKKTKDNFVSLKLFISYDAEFKSCVAKALKKKSITRTEIEYFVTCSIQQIFEELDEELDEEDKD